MIADYSMIYAGQFYNIDENEDPVFSPLYKQTILLLQSLVSVLMSLMVLLLELIVQ